MSPALPRCHHINVVVAYPEFLCKDASIPAFEFFSNLKNLSFRKLAVWMIFSLVSHGAFFYRSISHVFSMRCEKQMFWIPTRRIIAFVANLHFFRYWTKVKQPRKPMGSTKFCFVRNRAIPVFVFGSNPNKTLCFKRAFLNYCFFFKAFQNKRLWERHSSSAFASIFFDFSVKTLHVKMISYSYTQVN